MGKCPAIFNGAADEAERTELTDQQQEDFMRAWAGWAQANESALVDPGAPLFRKRRLSTQGVEDFTDAAVAYAVVEASSHEEAVQICSGHPTSGCSPATRSRSWSVPAGPS